MPEKEGKLAASSTGQESPPPPATPAKGMDTMATKPTASELAKELEGVRNQMAVKDADLEAKTREVQRLSSSLSSKDSQLREKDEVIAALKAELKLLRGATQQSKPPASSQEVMGAMAKGRAPSASLRLTSAEATDGQQVRWTVDRLCWHMASGLTMLVVVVGLVLGCVSCSSRPRPPPLLARPPICPAPTRPPRPPRQHRLARAHLLRRPARYGRRCGRMPGKGG